MRTKEELTRLKKLLIDTCDDLLYECNELIEAKDKDMIVKEREDYYTTIFSSIPGDILKAADANYLKADDRESVTNTNLSAAEQLIAKIGSDDNTFQTMANYYIYAANEYYNINNTDKMFELLQLAENAANNINKSSTKLSSFKSIVQAYGNNEQVETGYEKALEFGSDTTNRNSLIKELVTIVTSKNDFEDSEYATVDTDKDGNPDFFYPWVTAEDISQSGLTLDDDIDSDGINDNEDTLPYVVNK